MKLPVILFFFCCGFLVNGFGQKDHHLVLSPKITVESKSITNFDKLVIGEDFEVIIRFSDKDEGVKIEANENLHDYIIVGKEGNTLILDTKSYHTGSYNSNWKKRKEGARERLTAYVTTKNLVAIKAEEDVDIELENTLTTSNLTIKLEEDCVLSGDIEVKNLIADLEEDCVLDLEGSAYTLELNAYEDSQFKNYDFTVQDLVVDLRGDSQAKLTVNGNIDVRASGDSQFTYKGKGTIIRERIKGDSSVRFW